MIQRNKKGQFIKGYYKNVPKEVKDKISSSLQGHTFSEETKEKIRKTLTGRKLTTEHIAKVKEKSWMNDQSGEKNKIWKGGISKTMEYKRHMKEQNKMRRKQVEGSHTFEEWKNLKKIYKYMCLCCKRTEPEIKLTEDHIIPVSKGGTDYIWNIQPLCLSCNVIKNAKTIDYRSAGWFG